ncbi:MAG TPA: hypothetical protein RMG48_06795 [Myxococcales bacterium LLY-WYZ-16_1]|nr:hypothetical protein [Myxococcales bacterium LLY-WYZ-16_1]
MKSTLILCATGVLTSFGVTSSVVWAQSPATPPLQSGPDAKQRAELQQKMQKLRKVRTRLEKIRDQALDAPSIKKKRDALQSKVEAAMEKADPKVAEKRDRFEELREKFVQARKSQDMDTMQALQPKLQELGSSLRATQNQVMKQDGISEMADSFQDAMITQMKQIDPETDALMETAERLSRELQAAMGRPAAPAPAP